MRGMGWRGGALSCTTLDLICMDKVSKVSKVLAPCCFSWNRCRVSKTDTEVFESNLYSKPIMQGMKNPLDSNGIKHSYDYKPYSDKPFK